MSEDEYRLAVAQARIDAVVHLHNILAAWRRELWPEPYSEPIGRENRRRQLRAELAAQAYWGAPRQRLIYGGICAS